MLVGGSHLGLSRSLSCGEGLFLQAVSGAWLQRVCIQESLVQVVGTCPQFSGSPGTLQEVTSLDCVTSKTQFPGSSHSEAIYSMRCVPAG